ncbi:ribosome silencing factor [Rhodothermus profundi]|uniref:Ribosomal silencing factor RsfS n=1 Tax=Rhodothermus profundi TaxID=633813 RepID=A0A1M6QFU2_9BACT|nr:ribosome silencing factor [Rhodothermus profundi]SHK19045.1 ribosome-associated protein [Rhodothermus profundi]
MAQLQTVSPLDAQQRVRYPSRVLARHAVDAALEKKAQDLVVIDMRQVSGVADYFVLCTGQSDLQIRAIAEAIEERIEQCCQERPWHVEGREHLQWVVLDYVDVVVHIFTPEKRAFYNLERLWGDAPQEQVTEDRTGAEVQLLKEPIATTG